MRGRDQLTEGLALLARAVRSSQWEAGSGQPVTPAQAALLQQLAACGGEGQSINAISNALGIRQPTASAAVATLVSKGMVKRERDPHDARAQLIQLTAKGRKLAELSKAPSSPFGAALDSLSPALRGDLMRSISLTIRAMQQSGAIAPQRLCVSCRHFRAFAHKHANQPHHCAFVDAAFGDGDLRVNCSDHDTADPAFQAATWQAFNGPDETLRANQT